MNGKQRKRQTARRRQHEEGAVRPRRVLNLKSYPVVKQGHIIPATFQRNFAVDERVAVHIEGVTGGFPQNVKNAGTHGPFYRRIRLDGSQIDDIEASLGSMESAAAPVLAEVAGGAPMTADAKGVLAQFFALQMVRGPVFFSTVEGISSELIREGVQPETVSPEILAQSGGDIQAVRERALAALWMQRFQDMLGRAQKASWILACMRWRVLRFAAPVVAYSDQPVVLWPIGKPLIDARPQQPTLGPLSALEIRVPLSSHLILLMTWDDISDIEVPLNAPPHYASETNALVIAQAHKQWMHRPGAEPPIARHRLRPIAEALEPYDHTVVWRSRRRQLAQKEFERVDGRTFVNTVKMITTISAAPIVKTRSSTGAQPRRARTQRSRR